MTVQTLWALLFRPSMVGVLLCVGVLSVGVGCGISWPKPYLESKAAGHRAYSSGRFEEAAEHFREAAPKAKRQKDRDEVLFLEASAYYRAGNHEQARALYEALLKLSPDGLCAARAAHEIAKLEIKHGDVERGWEMVHEAIVRYPVSGLTRPSVQRYLLYLDDEQGLLASIAYLEKWQPWLAKHELGDFGMYERAKRLEELGRLKEAHDGFLLCAKMYPYPKGGLFDDALYRVSVIDEKLGRPREAIEHLRELLRYREASTLHGSYERPMYPQAQMRIAELYRDAVGDPVAARREFRRFFELFPTSVMRHKALWSEAMVAHGQGDKKGACDAVGLLVREFPESRFSPCAGLVCDDVRKSGQRGQVDRAGKPRECRDYIARSVVR